MPNDRTGGQGSPRFQFALLGPLEVRLNDHPIVVPGASQRALLATLVLHANEVTPIAAIVEALWGHQPPSTATNALQAAVYRLRHVLADGAPSVDSPLLTRPQGYLLWAPSGTVDIGQFTALTAAARRDAMAADWLAASQQYAEALRLWRGPALADVVSTGRLHGEAQRLDEERLATVEERIDVDLMLGRHAQ